MGGSSACLVAVTYVLVIVVLPSLLSKELFPDAKVILIGSISQFTVMMAYVT